MDSKLSKIIIALFCFSFIATSLVRSEDRSNNNSSSVGPAPARHGGGGGGTAAILTQLAAIRAQLNQIQALVTPPAPVADNTTRLLFPYATNTAGFDTGLAITNSGSDNTGTVGQAGTATIYFFQGTTNPMPFTTPVIQAGASYQTTISTIAPGFNGYLVVVCNFPFGHGFGFLSDVGARNLAANIPALVLPGTRTNTVLESQGQ